MRLKFKLNYRGANNLPINYNYFLSSSIYELLRFGKPEFSKFLHDKGYRLNNKSYKLFTFALLFEKFTIEEGSFKLLSPSLKLIVSSPLIEDFLKTMVISSFKKQIFELSIKSEKFIFDIQQIERLPHPNFKEEMKFLMLTPMVLSTFDDSPSKNNQYYLRYFDNINLINKVFNNNLKNKFKLIKQKEYKGNGVTFEWDKSYIKNALARRKKITKKITIYSSNNKIDVIGNLAPFYLKGDPQLMEIGYEAGFGEKNSMGFGMAKAIG